MLGLKRKGLRFMDVKLKTVNDLIRFVGRITGTPFEDITGPQRARRLCALRCAITIEARRWGCSYPQIARRFDDRDHTTVMNWLKSEPMYRMHFGKEFDTLLRCVSNGVEPRGILMPPPPVKLPKHIVKKPKKIVRWYTPEEHEKIVEMRLVGRTWDDVANALNRSVESVKRYRTRTGMAREIEARRNGPD